MRSQAFRRARDARGSAFPIIWPSPGGPLIAAVIDLDFALQVKIAIGLADIPYPVFLLLRQLAEERDKHQAEQIRKPRR